jgi:flavin reductase (NADH)
MNATNDAAASYPRDMVAAMARLAAGVSVVTVKHGGAVWGLTISSLISLSLHPPMVLFSLHDHSSMLERIDATRGFGISMLTAEQKDIATELARRDRGPLPDHWVQCSNGEVPWITGALAQLQVRKTGAMTLGDHVAVTAEVLSSRWTDAAPLVYQLRGYRTLKEIAPIR